MTYQEVTDFMLKCHMANIIIPNDIIALYDDLYNDLPYEMQNMKEVELREPTGRINVIDTAYYKSKIKL